MIKNTCTQKKTHNPFFSIGVTTYNRRDLLMQTLATINSQTFSDFEVIIGNDFPDEILTPESIAIDDSRYKIINHPKNLGEVGNMNTLLQMSCGNYFTWMGDDDLYSSDFFQAVYDAIKEYSFPDAAFTSFETIRGIKFPEIHRKRIGESYLLNGRQFLCQYLDGQIKLQGAYGVYKRDVLCQIGGMANTSQGNPVGIYPEYLLLINCGKLNNIAYVDSPLILFRSHSGSRAKINFDSKLHCQAGLNLINESLKILNLPNLRKDLAKNYYALVKLPLYNWIYKYKAENDSKIDERVLFGYLQKFERQLRLSISSYYYWGALISLIKNGFRLYWHITGPHFTLINPSIIARLLHRLHPLLYKNEPAYYRGFW